MFSLQLCYPKGETLANLSLKHSMFPLGACLLRSSGWQPEISLCHNYHFIQAFKLRFQRINFSPKFIFIPGKNKQVFQTRNSQGLDGYINLILWNEFLTYDTLKPRAKNCHSILAYIDLNKLSVTGWKENKFTCIWYNRKE